MAESKGFWEDIKWGEEHYLELQKQYRDNWVAIVGKKVVCFGKNLGEVEEKAKKLTKKETVYTLYIESGAHIY